VPTFKQFKLPDLGEGLTEGEILRWLVEPGEEITLNQPIVEVETAKAAVEVPSPYAGVVSEIHHQAGETVDVGAPIITVDVDPGGEPAPSGSPSRRVGTTPPAIRADLVPELPRESGEEDEAAEDSPGGGESSVLVGYGPRSASAVRRPRRPGAIPGARTGASPVVDDPVPAPPGPGRQPVRHGGLEVGRAAALRLGPHGPALAKPPVRKLARDLGVDLHRVSGTGPGGSITRDDVHAANGGSTAGRFEAPPRGAAPGEREHREPMRGVRKLMAEAMVASAFTAPHVTEFLTVDCTRSLELLDRLRGRREFAGLKLSPLLVAAKALLIAAQRHPGINARLDEAAGEIVTYGYVNLGIAAATPRGLVVPNIKDADRLPLPDLAAALAELASTARAGRTPPGDMQGGTITITNVGVFGVDTGTPILNPPEAAILALGQVAERPWVVDGAVLPRSVVQLALAFDHRLVDGELGSLVLAEVGAILQDPALALAL
jgi:pyruvate dehydrogenase E2 component (dihydrolipoamide acetyltransferase)